MHRIPLLFTLIAFGAFTALAPPPGLAAERTEASPHLLRTTAVFETVFGPHEFLRDNGRPQTFTETFTHCGSGDCRLVVANGNPDGSNRTSSATILLNGVPVLGPSDLNPQVAEVSKDVTLTGDNTLTVIMRGKPGSSLSVTVQCEESEAQLTLGPPSSFLVDPTTLSLAIPIINDEPVAATNVQITTLSITGMTLTVPTLPYALGTIPAEGSTVLNTTFTGPFVPSQTYAVTLEGTFTEDGVTECFDLTARFTLPPLGPGSGTLTLVDVVSNAISGAPFPPVPPDFDEDETNPSGWVVPDGPFQPGVPTPNQTQFLPAPVTALEGDQVDGVAPITWAGNRGVGISGSTTAEPSGASGGGVVFVTANWFAAFSTNNGATWTQLDPTTVFPADAVGFCCDQIVQYVPSIDRFVWLLQGNGYRLAVASPAQIISSNGTAWTYWNLTPQVFGQPAGTGLDYPDVSVGNNQLYMSWDMGAGCPAGCTSGFQVVRTSLAGLQAGGTITLGFTNPAHGTMAWGSKISQNTLDEVFWAGHNSNSQMRIFSLQEASNSYFWRDRNVSSWPNNRPTSLTPDNRDWLAKNFNGPGGNSFPRNGVIGATRAAGRVWFGWTAGTNSFFQQAHVELVAFDPGNSYSKTQQVQIWNNDYAFAYPALANNLCSNEVGLSLEYGGNGHYENHVVGFWGDFVVYVTTNSNVGTTRFGDYVTLRQRPGTTENPGNLFDAFGYGLRSAAGGGTTVDIRYVTFGRDPSSCIIIRNPSEAAANATAVKHELALAVSHSPMVRGSEVTVNFTLPAAGEAKLRIYDASGAHVRTLVDGSLEAGDHAVAWTGTNDRTQAVAPGVYFVALDAAGRKINSRVIVLP